MLAASVRACGVIHPLLVVPHPDLAARGVTPYQILVGERRWLAARRASLATVPAVVREERLSPADRLMLQIAESDGEHREELALFDLASAVARAFALARCTQVQFAQRHRRSQAWLCNLLRLAQAEGLTREALREGLLQGVLAALTYLRLTPGQQRHLLSEALASVRAGRASRNHHGWSADPWAVAAGLPLPWRPAPFHPNAAGMRAVADLILEQTGGA